MALRLEKIVFVFKLRIVPTSSEDSRTTIFACPHVLCFEKVQVAFGLALCREVTFTLEIFNPSKGRLLTYVGGTLPRQRSWRPSGERLQRVPACSAAGWPPPSPPRPGGTQSWLCPPGCTLLVSGGAGCSSEKCPRLCMSTAAWPGPVPGVPLCGLNQSPPSGLEAQVNCGQGLSVVIAHCGRQCEGNLSPSSSP